ncbi:ABC-type Mn2+/Zn2+ transport system, ATPase component [Lentimicrobium saccharophilum]|uniref:ABC-type Mn2+/Zn2+ transport system, ATPase component n=1 Tax=Lentimicrobium saccharophilum TaxID=1678841 RepID=A0A0S7BX78_9BACT|nr:ABC transporter ATP-binding protein [Lentimicrobium saccharophilum]GAP43031.1 ABC-type Mn2+/Zn2+ transport system, ATPase component [Lentimicrobium saccharophilum]
MQEIVEIRNASAGYSNEVVLHNVSLSIQEKDYIGVIGPNGGGKTTLVKLILRLIPPMQGEVIYYGADQRNLIGYLPQVSKTDRSFPISVNEVVLSGLMSANSGLRRFTRSDKSRALEILEMMGIAHLRKKSIGELSGGQMQRAFLGRAIISEPRLLILDEPNTFVDNKFEHDLYELLSHLNERMAIMMVSHDVGTITTYVKTIACVNRNLHYHRSNIITQSQLAAYNCPIQLITHGEVPHTVLGKHHHNHD